MTGFELLVILYISGLVGLLGYDEYTYDEGKDMKERRKQRNSQPKISIEERKQQSMRQ
jgi:ssRNA-specific RNase YbeY (16S rRNA maturation enzyme)